MRINKETQPRVWQCVARSAIGIGHGYTVQVSRPGSQHDAAVKRTAKDNVKNAPSPKKTLAHTSFKSVTCGCVALGCVSSVHDDHVKGSDGMFFAQPRGPRLHGGQRFQVEPALVSREGAACVWFHVRVQRAACVWYVRRSQAYTGTRASVSTHLEVRRRQHHRVE